MDLRTIMLWNCRSLLAPGCEVYKIYVVDLLLRHAQLETVVVMNWESEQAHSDYLSLLAGDDLLRNNKEMFQTEKA